MKKDLKYFCDNGCPKGKPVQGQVAHIRRYRGKLISVREYCRRKPRQRK